VCIVTKLRKQFHDSRIITTAFTYNTFDYKDKPIEFNKRNCDELKHSETSLTSVIKGENVYDASYILSYHIASCCVVHTVSGNLYLS
jgi:hypothetical protein